MKVVLVVGARPNFMKMAPIYRELSRRGQDRVTLVHTGQHYDQAMSDVFFDQLGMPQPDVNLGVGSASHAIQTAKVMMEFEPVVLEHQPDLVLVAGDVNSTLACALTAAKLGVAVGHVEAGLRSRDWTMPEEINRVLTDRLSDLLFTPSRDANENLKAEGIDPARIHFVGNVMIDTLVALRPAAESVAAWEAFGLEPGVYGLVTLHRPSNVDHPETLGRILGALATLAREVPLIWPLHPLTEQRLTQFGLMDLLANCASIRTTGPLGYIETLSLMSRARLVLTDSGGMQEETTALGVPCLTLRENTERPITCSEGTNTLVGPNPERILSAANEILDGRGKPGQVPELLDGHAAERIVEVLARRP